MGPERARCNQLKTLEKLEFGNQVESKQGVAAALALARGNCSDSVCYAGDVLAREVAELHGEKMELLDENASLKKVSNFYLAGSFRLAAVHERIENGRTETEKASVENLFIFL